MEPVSLIVTALATGAASALKEGAGTAVKDAYGALKSLLHRRFGDRIAAAVALEEHERRPETWQAPLIAELQGIGAEKDEEIVAAAQEVLKHADPQNYQAGKYNIQIAGNVQGLVQGDHATVDMNFGAPMGTDASQT